MLEANQGAAASAPRQTRASALGDLFQNIQVIYTDLDKLQVQLGMSGNELAEEEASPPSSLMEALNPRLDYAEQTCNKIQDIISNLRENLL